MRIPVRAYRGEPATPGFDPVPETVCPKRLLLLQVAADRFDKVVRERAHRYKQNKSINGLNLHPDYLSVKPGALQIDPVFPLSRSGRELDK